MESLGDRYSAFLAPDQYRVAIRHPKPSEIKYLAFQYTGVGIEVQTVAPLISNCKASSVLGLKQAKGL